MMSKKIQEKFKDEMADKGPNKKEADIMNENVDGEFEISLDFCWFLITFNHFL